MDGIVIDEALIEALWAKARSSERLRQNFDLRTTPADTSQRMLNALMPGTQVPIHRHEETTETVVCLKGRLEVVFFDQTEEGSFVETSRVELCPLQGKYGAQIPQGAFHTVEVHEPSCIFEAKDGKYVG
jgi:cupin fold WbuC family metalloprotein